MDWIACSNGACPLKEKCARYRENPRSKDDLLFKPNKDGTCNYFMFEVPEDELNDSPGTD